MLRDDMQLAAAVGAKVLEWKGSEIIELIYLLEEKDALKTLREISRLSEDDKSKLLKFMKRLHNDNERMIKSCDAQAAFRVKRDTRSRKAI